MDAFPDGAILLVKAPQGKPSHVWKVICKAYSTLKDGFSVRIGNEASNVWFDNWTRTEPLCTKVVYDDIQGVDLTLSNLITGGKWNLGKKHCSVYKNKHCSLFKAEILQHLHQIRECCDLPMEHLA
ncbi:hypothetical protein JHK87_010226 [Glycine soja]|nr:hypothetical protein JHK87_010226 [Glycine soja]